MINALSGIVTDIIDHELTVQLDSLFLSVLVAQPAKYKIGEKVMIKTYVHWNQEHGFSLYGFENVAQKLLFLELLSCNGIGPRLALSIIAALSIQETCRAVKTNDLAAFTNISGIGQKKAEQIVVHMKHALKALEPKLIAEIGSSSSAQTTILKDVENTLLALQYTRNEIYAAIRLLSQEHKDFEQEKFDFVLRKTLQYLSQARSAK